MTVALQFVIFVIFSSGVLVSVQDKDTPIIVNIKEPEKPSDLAGLADVLIGAFGITGVLIVAALVLAGIMGGFLSWYRSREES